MQTTISPNQLPNTELQPNNGWELTTEAILKSMKEINSRPETKEFFNLIKKSDQYIPWLVTNVEDEYR